MIIRIELPDSTKAAFVNYVTDEGDGMVLVSKGLGTKDLERRYKDCREYEVNSDESA